MTNRLDGKVAIVTGGNSGIGESTAHLFAQEGAKVIIMARREDQGKAVETAIRAAGGEATFIACDVSDESIVNTAVEQASAIYGEINVLFNNAGIYPAGTIDDITVEQWDHVFAVNTRGTFLTTRGALKHLRRASDARRIINIGSVIPGLGAPGMLHYSASKAAIAGFTHSLSRELSEDGINVNCIVPSQVATDTVMTLYPGADGPIVEQQSIKRYQQPRDLMGALVFLASDASEFMTGQSLVVDGGRLLL